MKSQNWTWPLNIKLATNKIKVIISKATLGLNFDSSYFIIVVYTSS
jgi:hypothetical protein